MYLLGEKREKSSHSLSLSLAPTLYRSMTGTSPVLLFPSRHIRAPALAEMRTPAQQLPAASYSSWLLLLLWSALLVRGWESGFEYSYDYEGRLGTEAKAGGASVHLLAQLTVQAVEDGTTLLMKLSEVRIARRGNYTLRGGSPDQITLPAGGGRTTTAEEEEEEAVGDSLHLLSPFSMIHNKGSILNLVVEKDEPEWCINVKKSLASQLQLDVSGVRSVSVETLLPVFGERSPNSRLAAYEDGVTGDCSTTLQTTRLPFYQAVHHGDLCRASNIYEIVKMRDLSRCRNPPAGYSSLQRSSVSKYLVCGESAERGTIAEVESRSEASLPAVGIRAEQTVRLTLSAYGPIRQLLPPLAQPRILDSLAFVDPSGIDDDDKDDDAPVGAEEFDGLLKSLQSREWGDKAGPERLSRASRALSRFHSAQLRQMWLILRNNIPTRDLFIDCVSASGSLRAVSFILDLIVERELQSFRSVWALASAGLAVQQHSGSPSITPVLQRFVDLIQPGLSKTMRMSALLVAAELLHDVCVRHGTVCRPDTKIITDDFLPLAVRELSNKARSTPERVAVITALGILGTDDVLLLLVPYIRGERTPERIAAVLALERLMDTSPDKVTPLLASLADNVAEQPEIRMAAIRTLAFHESTPLFVWKQMAYRTWFETNRQVHAFTYGLIRSLTSTSSKARMVIDLARESPSSAGHQSGSFEAAGFLSHWSVWRGQHSSSLPTFVGFKLFYEIAKARFNPVHLSVWNHNMEPVWNRLLGYGASGMPPPDAGSDNDTNLDEFWYQLLAPQHLSSEEDHQQRAGLVHLNLMGAQMFLNLEDIIPDGMSPGLFWKGLGQLDADNIQLTKFHQLLDIHLSVPTDLGLPAYFRSSLSVLASAHGWVHQARLNLTAVLTGKWTGEVRAELPFSGNYVSAGETSLIQLRAPLRLNVSIRDVHSLEWNPPTEPTDLAVYHMEPYVVAGNRRNMKDDPEDEVLIRQSQSRLDQPSILPLGLNLRLETIGGDGDLAQWIPSGLRMQPCAYRLTYFPDELIRSVSLSIHGRAGVMGEGHPDTVDYLTGGNDTLNKDPGTRNSSSMTGGGEPSGYGITIQAEYENGSWMGWESEQLDWGNTSGTDLIHLPAFTPLVPWLLGPPQLKKCQVGLERITTFDGVDYDYGLNGCQHLLVAELKRYAVTARRDGQNMTIRITLPRDVIDVEPSGEVIINGIAEDAPRVRLHDGNKFLIVVERVGGDQHVLIRMPSASLDMILRKESVQLRAGSLHAKVHGLCGDGDGETVGEFKTAGRCALSSGSLMAASFQMSTGFNDCPAMLPEDVSESLQRETYPCYSVDEQVTSALPLPPES